MTITNQKQLYGGVRFFYDIPDDEDLLSVEAVYTNQHSESFKFASSYFIDSLDVYGFASTEPHTVKTSTPERAPVLPSTAASMPARRAARKRL